MPLAPYTGPFGKPELMHLLRRSLFGATPGDLVHFDGMTLDQTIDELLSFTNDTLPPVKAYSDETGNPDGIDPTVAFGTTWVTTPVDPQNNDLTGARLASWAAWWAGLMVDQDRTLREKLTLFWHNHMPTQIGVVFHSEAAYRMNQLLRTRCGGNFRQLIHDVSLEPAMLIYLNGYLNVAGSPDENYARELLELFTLGQGSGYSEADVQAAARVLTGWTVLMESGGDPILPEPIFLFFNHDQDDKQFSSFFNDTLIAGQTGPNAGETELNALLDMIMANEGSSRFLCRELYRFFVHGEIDAATEADVIVPLAQLFCDNAAAPDQMRIVLRALLTSDHFFSDAIRGCMIKSPVDLVIGELRLFGMPFPTPVLFEARHLVMIDLYWLVGYAGQNLADPPNVAGWPAYYLYPAYDDLWIDTASFPARNNSLLGTLYGGFDTPSNTVLPESADLLFQFDLIAFTQQLDTPTDPELLIDQLCEFMYVTPISEAVKDQLKQSYLLLGQSNDDYWSIAYATYVADPDTTDMTAQLVPDILKWLIGEMQKAAEHHLF